MEENKTIEKVTFGEKVKGKIKKAGNVVKQNWKPFVGGLIGGATVATVVALTTLKAGSKSEDTWETECDPVIENVGDSFIESNNSQENEEFE